MKQEHDMSENLFSPHLIIKVSQKVPSPILIAALVGVEKILKIDLPKYILELSLHKQISVVRKVIREHFKQSQGQTMAKCFGSIEGYFFKYSAEKSLLFDTQGNVCKIGEKCPELKKARLGFGKDRISLSMAEKRKI